MRPRTSIALFCASALLLTGCGQDEPEPKMEPEPSASPAAEKEETAEEFIRRWNDEQREMQKGDTTEYRRIAGECEPCMETAERIDGIYAAGGFVKTEGRTVRSIRKSERSPNIKHAYVVEVISAPTTYKNSSKAPEESLDGGDSVYEVRLSKKDGEWVLIDTWAVPL